MKVAIIYTTKGGTTKECAELLERELSGHDTSVRDMSEAAEIGECDVVVLGFPIKMGKACKQARKYIKEHISELAERKVAYYMCCGFIDCAEEYAEKVLPRELYDNSLTVTCLGGSLEPSRFKGIDRIIVKAVRAEILGGGDNGEERSDMSLPTILDENIAQLADLIKSTKT